MIEATLLAGGTPGQREAAIAALLDPSVSSAAVLEGIPDGGAALETSDSIVLARISAGCPCCSGNLVLRVTLNRLLRNHPSRLYIALASDAHLAALRAFLAAPPYANLLRLTQDVVLDSRSQ